MEFEIFYNNEKHIIFARVHGKTDFQMAYNTSVEGKRIADENNCNRFLIDMTNAIVKYSIFDAVEFVVGLTELKFSRKDKVAFIINRDKEKFNFAEKIALNRGWFGIKHFTDYCTAENWLFSK